MEAQIIISGNIGNDIEFKETNGFPQSRFRMACTPRKRTSKGWEDDFTTWVQVVCVNSLALNVRETLHKGEPVIVSGKLRTYSWKADDGKLHDMLILDATTVGYDLRRGIAKFKKVARGTSAMAADFDRNFVEQGEPGEQTAQASQMQSNPFVQQPGKVEPDFDGVECDLDDGEAADGISQYDAKSSEGGAEVPLAS